MTIRYRERPGYRERIYEFLRDGYILEEIVYHLKINIHKDGKKYWESRGLKPLSLGDSFIIQAKKMIQERELLIKDIKSFIK